MLLLAACAPHPPSAPAIASLDVPLDVRSDGPVAPAAPVDVVHLDEAGLAALLANPSTVPLVVNFWATWCGPCVAELRLLGDLSARHPDVGFALVSVDSARDAARVEPLLRGRGVFLPAYHLQAGDPSPVLARQVPGWPDIIPVTVVVAPGGGVVVRFDGALDGPELEGVLPP